MKELKVEMNGLVIGADWLSFTILDEMTPFDVIEMMGFHGDNFKPMPNGANGYRRMSKFENITVLYDGTENMGIHVNISGSSIATVLERFYRQNMLYERISVANRHTEKNYLGNPFGDKNDFVHDYVLSCFCTKVLRHGHFTRIDIAIDDLGANYYTTDELIQKRQQGRIVTKWRTSKNYEEHNICDNSKVGHTVYFGSRQSEILMRVYDKRLEHNKSLSSDDANYIESSWVRWELELHKGRASKVAEYLSKGVSLGEVAIGVLSNYFRIVNLDNSNKSRCSNECGWERFVSSVEKLKITMLKEDKTFEERRRYFEKQNGRFVSALLQANGGDLTYFGDLGDRYSCKLTSQDLEQIGKEIADDH